MQKHQLYINLFTITSVLALAACADEVDGVVTPDAPEVEVGEKTSIELSVGGTDASPLTRVVISDGTGKTLSKLPNGSSIYMLMKADDLSESPKTTLCTRTVGFAQDISGDDTKSNVSFTASGEGAKFTRYWDDVFARSSAISIAAVCTPGYGPKITGKKDEKAWQIGGNGTFDQNKWILMTELSEGTTLYWPVGKNPVINDQSTTPDFITFQDLCFSNNIGNNSDKEGYSDTRMKFDAGTKTFTTGNLVFYHALSKLTFNIKKGEGFSDDEFTFKDGTNIALSNFYNGGTFDISSGEFLNTEAKPLSKTTINKIFKRTLTSEETTAGIKYGLDALVIPGTDMSASAASATNAVSFILGGNEYKLSMAQLYEKFTTDQKTQYFEEGKLKAGVHYIFTFTVAKTKISGLSAQVVGWESVTADNITPTNARISLKLEERGDYVTEGVDFYRAKDTGNSEIQDDYAGYIWKTGYNTNGKATETSCNTTTKIWSTPNWLWPDNTTFYHIRALAPTSQTVTTAENDYTSLSAGETYTDVRWGAPFLDNADDEAAGSFKIYYNTTSGFDATGTGSPNSSHQIYKGIGPTNDVIKLLMFHMMSDLTINVESVTGEAAVQLGNGTEENCTTIELKKIYKSGTVNLGNGLVNGVLESEETEKGDYPFTSHPAPSSGKITWANYGAIPQSLENVVLVITTPDKNEYRVAMKDVVATTPNYSNISYPAYTDGKVNYWYPGVKYTYNFKLSKKKIEAITATVVDWENVTAGDDNVQIQ